MSRYTADKEPIAGSVKQWLVRDKDGREVSRWDSPEMAQLEADALNAKDAAQEAMDIDRAALQRWAEESGREIADAGGSGGPYIGKLLKEHEHFVLISGGQRRAYIVEKAPLVKAGIELTIDEVMNFYLRDGIVTRNMPDRGNSKGRG